MKEKTTYEIEMTVEEFMDAIKGFEGKTLYAVGGFCEKLTLSKLNQKAKQYPDWYYRTKCAVPGYRHLTNYQYLSDMMRVRDWFIADCCGLIKGVRAGYRADGTMGRMTPEIDEPIDKMAAGLINKTDAKNVPYGGMIFFPDYSHVAVISEPGVKDIESAPTTNGVKEVSINYQPRFKNAQGGLLPWIDYRIPKKKIEEDGLWGMETTRRAQQEFGTYEDGIVSRQLSRFKSRMPGCVAGWHWTGVSGDGGSDLIRAMQKWLKVEVDGHCGTQTIMALQKKMGTPVDGVLDKPSQCIKAFQHYLNER